MEEGEAIAKLKRGNIAVLQALVEMYQVQAVHIAILITQDRATAEDVLQNAFIRCFEHIAQFDAARPFRPWFFRILTNDALKVVERQKRQIHWKLWKAKHTKNWLHIWMPRSLRQRTSYSETKCASPFRKLLPDCRPTKKRLSFCATTWGLANEKCRIRCSLRQER